MNNLNNVPVKLRKGWEVIFRERKHVLDEAEFGYSVDEKLLKIGDGETHWRLLPHFLTSNDTVEGGASTPGLSAYEVAVDNGFVGTEVEWLESLVGETGADSIIPGPQGPAGPSDWVPADNELLAANFPPRHIVTGASSVSGNYFFHRVKIPADTLITSVVVFVITAGASLTYSRAAVYEADGTQVGLTADQSTPWQSIGAKTMALETPVAAEEEDRWVWVAIAAAGTTVPVFGSAQASSIAPSSIGMSQPINNGYRAGAAPLPVSTVMTFTAWAEMWIGIK